MFAVSGTQGIALAILGPRLFARVSPGLQMILVALAALGFLALPVIDASVVDTLRATGPNARPWLLSTPPLWFLGLYERIIGTGNPVLLDLSRRALLTLLVAPTATLVSFPAAYRRAMRSAIEDSGAVARPGATTRVANVLIGIIARRAGQPCCRPVLPRDAGQSRAASVRDGDVRRPCGCVGALDLGIARLDAASGAKCQGSGALVLHGALSAGGTTCGGLAARRSRASWLFDLASRPAVARGRCSNG